MVSLTFDDGTSGQYTARSILASHGMHATFFVNSGHIGTQPDFLTWGQLRDLHADGNEIGGHTLTHVDLTTVDAAEQRRQVCDDRNNLIAQGFNVTSFAYPWAQSNETVKAVVRDCGYRSARTVGGINQPENPDYCPWGCPYAETIPPQDAFRTRTPADVINTTPLSNLQNYVMQAEANGGGWVQFVFHRICDSCGTYGVSPARFTALLDWLQPRSAQGTVVKTVQEVIDGAPPPPPAGDTTPPMTAIACNGSPCLSWYSAPVTVTLSATDAGSGVFETRYTTNGSDPTAASPLYSGPFSVSSRTTVKYRSWDVAGNVEPTRSTLIQFDTTAPTVAVTSPANGATVTRTVAVTASASDAASGVTAVRFYVDGKLLGTATTAPYKTSWNTRKTTSGSHTLHAVAVDAAGNAASSTPITVTVA